MNSKHWLKAFLYTSCVIVLFIGLPCTSLTQDTRFTRTLTLQDLGFASDVVLTGQKPYQAFYFPIPRGTLVNEQSYIEIDIRLSEALDPTSIVNVMVNDLPVRSYTLRQIGSTEASIKIPLAGLGFVHIPNVPEVEKKRFLKLVITGSLIITGDQCRDVQTGALYLIAKKNTSATLTVIPDTRGLSIASFLNDTEGDIRLILPQQPSGGTFQMGLWISGDLKKRFLYTTRKVSLFPIPDQPLGQLSGNYVVIAPAQVINELPRPFGFNVEGLFQSASTTLNDNGLIFLHTIGDAHILYITGLSDLAITKAGTAFILDHMRSAMISRAVLVKDLNRNLSPPHRKPPYSVTFKDLGYEHASLEGLGAIRTSYRFLGQSIGLTAKNLSLHLFGSTTAVRGGDNAFMNVYLNDLLVDSWSLNIGGRFQEKFVDLPNYALREDNRVDVEFVYFPQGECKGQLFSAEVFDISYIEVKALKTPDDAVFNVLPSIFSKNNILLISPRMSSTLFEAASTLLSALDRDPNSKYLYPRVMLSTSFTPEYLDRFNVIAVLSANDPALQLLKDRLPLYPNESFRVINTQNNTTMFDLKPSSSLGILQVFRPSSTTAMLLTTPFGRDGESMLRNFTEAIRDNPRLLEGNIGIYGEGGNVYFFNTLQRIAEIEYPDRFTWLSFIEKNKWLLFAILWIAFTISVVALSMYARRRSYKSLQINLPI